MAILNQPNEPEEHEAVLPTEMESGAEFAASVLNGDGTGSKDNPLLQQDPVPPAEPEAAPAPEPEAPEEVVGFSEEPTPPTAPQTTPTPTPIVTPPPQAVPATPPSNGMIFTPVRAPKRGQK